MKKTIDHIARETLEAPQKGSRRIFSVQLPLNLLHKLRCDKSAKQHLYCRLPQTVRWSPSFLYRYLEERQMQKESLTKRTIHWRIHTPQEIRKKLEKVDVALRPLASKRIKPIDEENWTPIKDAFSAQQLSRERGNSSPLG